MPPNRGHTGDVYTNRAFRQPRQPLHCHGEFFGTRLILTMTVMKGSVRPQTKGIASHCAMGLVEMDKCIERKNQSIEKATAALSSTVLRAISFLSQPSLVIQNGRQQQASASRETQNQIGARASNYKFRSPG